MASLRNKETQEALRNEIKATQTECHNTCSIIENAPPEFPPVILEEVNQKSLSYIAGLRTELENCNTRIPTDENLLTLQFVNEITQKTEQIDELIAFKRGALHDAEAEITRLKDLILSSQEAKSKPRIQRNEVMPEHIHKARERFKLLKSELYETIHALFPNSDMVIEVLGELMSELLSKESSGYVSITPDNYQVIELLKDINIVKINPYNNMEVKLSY